MQQTMSSPLRLFLLPFAAILTACITQTFNTASPFYNPPVGSRFVLHQPLPLVEGRYTVYLQNGVWGTSGFNRFEPHCQLDAKGVSDGHLVIQPDSYEVERVNYKTPLYVEKQPTQVASFGIFPMLASQDNDGPSDVITVVELNFKQTAGSQAWRLTCGGAQDAPARAMAPSIDEIRAALGTIASLKLPADS